MKTLDVLIEAKKLIQNPENWIQGDYSNEQRTCFCSLGAIAKVESVENWDSDSRPAALLLRAVVADQLSKSYNFAGYNDTHTHSEVMEAFDKAIELAKLQDS